MHTYENDPHESYPHENLKCNNNTTQGLFRKYKVLKANGDNVDPAAEYFVLRIDKDPHARIALQAYADSVKEFNPNFASDLRCWLKYGLKGFAKSDLKNMGF